MSHVVVIGAGQAGCALTAKLRNAGFDGQITLIGEEPVPPYQRPPLSKAYLLGEMEEERLYLRPLEFYAENAIDLRMGAAVEAVDVAAKTVSVSGEVIGYDALVFTTGSAPRRLPASIGGDLDGVFVVRTLADVDAMEARFREGAKALIVGGGYIGLEAAAVARKLGVSVTVLEMSDRILQRVACAETSDFVRALHAGQGVDIREGVGLERLLGDGSVTGAALTDGTALDVDFVIAGVGIVPGDALAGASGVALDNGIATDALGQTNVAGVWAAGDCASFPQGGAQMRLESVGHAIDHAELVAENILGAGKTYTPRPWFWSDQYDLKLQIAGLGGGHDRVVVREADGAVSHWYYAGDRLLAVDALNDPRSYMIGKRLIEAGKHPAPGLIADPDTDMKALLKS